MLRVLFAALCCVLLVPGAVVAQSDDPVVTLESGDPDMNAAIEQARSTLDLFFRNTVDDEGVSDQRAYVKVAVPAQFGIPVTHEHVWVGPFKTNGTQFGGILNSNPVHFDHTAPGEVLYFELQDISDWGWIAPNGKQFGYYTARVVIARLPAEEAAGYEGLFSDAMVPPVWE